MPKDQKGTGGCDHKENPSGETNFIWQTINTESALFVHHNKIELSLTH